MMRIKIPALNMQFIKYFFVGGMAAIVDFSVFAVLVKLIFCPWYFAALISFTVATLVNYVLSIKHVFESGVRFQKGQEIFLVFFVSLVGLGINQFILWLLITLMGCEALLAKIGATGVVFFWNYIARHRFVFSSSPALKR